jgi:GMP synthase-like glutamine amidotransferase
MRKVYCASGSIGDPVFNDLPYEFYAPQNHLTTVSRMPEGGTLLAHNEHGVQAFRIDNMYGIEFHPEQTPDGMRSLLKSQKISERMRAYNKDGDEILASIDNYDPRVGTILSNFLRLSWQGSQ